MKYRLESTGEIKEYGEMTAAEKKEVDDDGVKGALIFAGMMGGILAMNKL
jgi:hypothetical protein